MRFEDFVLQLDASSRGGYRARVLKSPFGEGTAGFKLTVPTGVEPALHDAPGISRDLIHRSTEASFGARPPLEIGDELFRSVFQGQVRTLLERSRGQLEISPNLGLRFKIKIDPHDEEAGALADLPWELLCDAETEDFFALSRQMSLVRYLDVPRPSKPISFTPPLRILAVGASPRGLDPLDLKEESDRLDNLNQSSSGVDVKFLPHASAGAVREALSKDTYHVLHFMGHGTFDSASGEGMLAFEEAGGALDLVSGKAFATKLRDLRSLGLVVLNACNTGRASRQNGANPFRGVATALVLGGVPAVVAMQRPISDRAAIGFSTAFYRHLANGDSIDEALTEGRQAIHSARPADFEWATPVLFLRTPEGHLFVPKPADAPEERIAPAAPAAPPIDLSTPGPAAPGRGLALKAASAAGAALMVFVLYNKVIVPSNVPGDSGQTEMSTDQTGLTLTTDSAPEEIERDVDAQSAKKEPRRTTPGTEPRAADVSTAQHTSPPPPAPAVDERLSQPTESIAATADVSNLSAQLTRIELRDEGGLRATVSFRNSADLPLKVVIDEESSRLSDNQHLSYFILDSDLPSFRLDLPPGGSAAHTFDFQAPKLGSNEFNLFLQVDGRRVKVTGSATL